MSVCIQIVKNSYHKIELLLLRRRGKVIVLFWFCFCFFFAIFQRHLIRFVIGVFYIKKQTNEITGILCSWFMKIKFKQHLMASNSININKTNKLTPHHKSLNTKRTRYMPMEIQVLVWYRHRKVAELKWLIPLFIIETSTVILKKKEHTLSTST